MTTKLKAAIYLSICLIMATGEPNETVSTLGFIAYYTFVFSNLIAAVYMVNKSFKHATTTN
jgi:hypothetical protein